MRSPSAFFASSSFFCQAALFQPCAWTPPTASTSIDTESKRTANRVQVVNAMAISSGAGVDALQRPPVVAILERDLHDAALFPACRGALHRGGDDERVGLAGLAAHVLAAGIVLAHDEQGGVLDVDPYDLAGHAAGRT